MRRILQRWQKHFSRLWARPGLGLMALLLCAFPAVALAASAPSVSSVPQLPDISKGQQVIIPVQDLSTEDVKVQLTTGRPNEKAIDIGSKVEPGSAGGKNVTFVADVPNGRYLVQLMVAGKPIAVPGELRVGMTPPTPGPWTVPQLPDITSGQHVSIPVGNLATEDVKVRLRTGRTEDQPYDKVPTIETGANGKAYTFVADVPTGRYLVSVISGGKEPGYAVPGELRVVADTDAQVVLDYIHPLTQYPSPAHQGYDLELVGQNFARKLEDNSIIVVGRGPESVIYDPGGDCEAALKTEADSARDKKVKPRPCLRVPTGLETKELILAGFIPDKYKGPLKMQVQVSKNVSQAVTVTLSRVSEAVVLLVTLAVFLALVWIVLRLVSKDVKQYKIADKSYGPLTAFFLDKETNSFSLSKFQLVAWTTVAVFGYLYLFVCRLLIQWDFQFPPIPENLPTLLGLSAGTAVAAAGITNAVGSKGAGDIYPSPADFISTGGLVVGERFQFFVWTLVGCLGFLSLLLATDPSALKELPKVPDGFLYLMGISSAAYLGGKAVRKAGPVIKTLAVLNVTLKDALPEGCEQPKIVQLRYPVLTLNVKGENLDPNATVQIDGQVLGRSDDFWINGAPDPQTHFCTDINLSLNDALNNGFLEGEHTLTLVNPDGQAATAKFPLDVMSITDIQPIPPAPGPAAPVGPLPAAAPAAPAPAAPLPAAPAPAAPAPAAPAPAAPAPAAAGTAPPTALKVTGKNFAPKDMTFEWRSPANAVDAKVKDQEIGPDEFVNETELKIKIRPGMAGPGKLTLISQSKLRASKEHTI